MMAHPAADHYPTTSRQFIHIKGMVAIDNPEVNGVLSLLRESFEVRPRNSGEVRLLLSLISKPKKLRPKLITTSRHQCQVSSFD